MPPPVKKEFTSRFKSPDEIESFYRELESSNEFQVRKTELVKQFQAKLFKLMTLKNNLEKNTVKLNSELDFKKFGELLKSHFHLIKKGMTELSVTDYYSSDQSKIILKLDPALLPNENLEKLFKKGKRRDMGLVENASRLENTELAILRIKKNIIFIQSAKSLSDLEFIPSEASKRKDLGSQKSEPRKYLSSKGLPILIGKTSLQNEEITFKIAKPNDIWMHIHQKPGPHLIVLLNKNTPLDAETLLEMGMLCLYFSGFKDDGVKEEVVYTMRKFVKKPRKGAEGAVLCTHEKTKLIKMERSILDKILEKTD